MPSVNAAIAMYPAMNPSDLVTHQFADDGRIPNNPVLPLVVYRGGIQLAGTPYPEELIEKTFAANGWGDIWRNDAVYAYPHYHSTIHEVMAVARGRTIVRFGGATGCEIDIGPGDVVILPAGTGHQGLFASPGLVVVGAYPPDGTYNLRRASKAERAKAIEEILNVPPPTIDPVFGPDGPLVTLWRPAETDRILTA
jgi:uncharacterized protein YjlB